MSLIQDDLFEGDETKQKMVEQMSADHMLKMLQSHYKLATVCFSMIFDFLFERNV